MTEPSPPLLTADELDWVRNRAMRGDAARYIPQMLATIDAQASELTALRKNIDQVNTLKEEAWARETALREALDGLIDECDKTIAHRQATGMRPATDISVFAATSLSGVLATRRALKHARALSGKQYDDPHPDSLPPTPASEKWHSGRHDGCDIRDEHMGRDCLSGKHHDS